MSFLNTCIIHRKCEDLSFENLAHPDLWMKIVSVRFKKIEAMATTWMTFVLIHYLTGDSSFDIDILLFWQHPTEQKKHCEWHDSTSTMAQQAPLK